MDNENEKLTSYLDDLIERKGFAGTIYVFNNENISTKVVRAETY